ncbi:hypothetical protein NKI96_14905 [Mesorhizobium sp. M0292]|uniref:hypothetical protein n=1 Tax=Mesorhizobium sp. M0292 TaxID=2956929 RepID=UPI0033387377
MLNRYFGLISLLVLSITSADVEAQVFKYRLSADDFIAEWVSSTGIVVTPQAKGVVWKAISVGIESQAKNAGLDTERAQAIAALMANAGYVTVVPGGDYGFWSNGTNKFAISSLNEFEVFVSASKYTNVTDILYKRPRIRIIVKPTPPRDYIITIDGQLVDSTELSEYVVNEGTVSVTITRKDRKDCLWEGEMAVGEVKDISCRL